MEKIREFIEGTRFLAPGIVAGLIFYMYADVKFDQFGFLLFCAIAVILVSALTDACLGILALLYSLGFWAWMKIHAKVKSDETPRLPPNNVGRIRSSARDVLETTRLPCQFGLALVLGIAAVNFYGNDSFFRLFSSFVRSPKVSMQNTNDRVLTHIVNKKFDYIDDRPQNSRACSGPDPNCSRDVYLRVKTKQGDFYEGAMRYFPMTLEVQGFYLSPACVSRVQDKLAYAGLEKIGGPGVYVPIADVAAIEYIDAISSDCFKLYYPKLWKA